MNREGYIQCANLYFVPILRQRLNFAVLVQRVQTELALDEQDAIAVALPPSVGPLVQTAIAKFPSLSLVIASLDSTQLREVFPVTPCDGIVEAIRIANERNIRLECIDRELAPGHLVGRGCVAQPDWPDDDLVLRLGARRYLDLIAHRVAHPPIRTEPVDTWREMAMAEKLRRLQPMYRRVLCVCEAAHVSQIGRLLSSPSQQFDISDEAAATPEFRVATPSLNIQLQYLDDFPKLVEVYERLRRDGRASQFDKRNALLDAVRHVEQNGPDLRISVREYEAFVRYVQNLLSTGKRVSPRPEDIFEACRGCFDEAFAERVNNHLVEYWDEIRVERVGRWAETGEPAFVVRHTPRSEEGEFVSRSCNPNQTQYRVREVIGPGEGEGGEDGEDEGKRVRYIHGWPPFEEFYNKMRRKVYTLSAQPAVDRKRHRFRGSLEAGIDARTTLRSVWRDEPELYVRQYTKHQGEPDTTVQEPIVWLLDLRERSGYSLIPWITGGGSSEEVYCEWIYYCSEKQQLYRSQDGSVIVECRRVQGYASFCDAASAVDALRAKFGSDFNRRIPRRRDLDDKTPLGECPAPLSELAWAGLSWSEILLLSAVIYAHKTVLCVLPEGVRLPSSVLSRASAQGKRIQCIPLSRFGIREREKLAVNYLLTIPGYHDDEQLNDPKFVRFRVRSYAPIMKQFWAE